MLLQTLSIEQYRGFSRFEMVDLGRINLIVGTNNSGKTSVLEAAHLLVANGDFSAFRSALSRRGEIVEEERDSGKFARNLDLRRLFHGHDLHSGSHFTIRGEGKKVPLSLRAEIAGQPHQAQLFEQVVGSDDSEFRKPPLMLSLVWKDRDNAETELRIDIGPRGGLSGSVQVLLPRPLETPQWNYRFITASSLTSETVVGLFEEIVLTKEEDLVLDAMRIIEPTIERIATSGTDRLRGLTRPVARGGMLVRCEGASERIPIGSMGDGIWRILGLALALVRTENGILLVDEIDTGLHFSVMEDMWRLVNQTAKRLNIQVLATTHSRDCYESLAVICRENVSENSDITIQRIERGRDHAIMYTEQEIIAAAKRGMEVR